MSDLLLNVTTGDLVIKDGDFVIVGSLGTKDDNLAAIQQDLSTQLKFFLGEWFLDTLAGVPYYDDILVKNPNATTIDGLLKNVILSVSGVLGLESFNLSYDAKLRKMSLVFEARTTAGQITQSEELVIP